MSTISDVDIRDWEQGELFHSTVHTSTQDKTEVRAKLAESDPLGRNPNEPGAKLDAGKAPVFRGLLDYFPRACSAVAEVSEVGAKKYTWKGWETVPDGYNRYSDALARHLLKGTYELLDVDTNLTHAAHAAWNALARLELLMKDKS